MKNKNKLIILQGPPASGKSTFAKDYAKENKNCIIVNRDNIRLMTKGFYDCKNYEDYISEIEISCVKNGLNMGYDVIVDATNLNHKTISKWEKLANDISVDIEFKEFYIPFKEAVERDQKRGENGGISVGKKVLDRFYRTYYKEKYENEIMDKRPIIEYQENLKDCIICDLDRTIALSTGRSPFDWSRINEDKCDKRLKYLLSKLHGCCDCEIIFLTGRDEEARDNTERWLLKNMPQFMEWTLEMKESEHKFEKGYLFKERFYEENIKNKYNVIAVFDDEENCINMWRSKGLLTCQMYTDN
jgi:predicted kinase